MIRPVPAEYRLVYQGGHHNVYCDGMWHIWTAGGIFDHPPDFIREGDCDCEEYRECGPSS